MSQPNILIIQADQAAAQWLPIYGHPVAKMPHLSALAKQGVVFENAYCNSSLCAPSRFSMTAAYPHHTAPDPPNSRHRSLASPTICGRLAITPFFRAKCTLWDPTSFTALKNG